MILLVGIGTKILFSASTGVLLVPAVLAPVREVCFSKQSFFAWWVSGPGCARSFQFCSCPCASGNSLFGSEFYSGTPCLYSAGCGGNFHWDRYSISQCLTSTLSATQRGEAAKSLGCWGSVRALPCLLCRGRCVDRGSDR
ncbi:unnamed protein product [Brassica oleracea var. botrytis]|uniref:Uncharacterized protein n=1 Tax=Brassica oleracea TaxID=3712 RepID=A0A3P6ED95_BRAOL|nr:unnamed protein product [Brassica oleracea]